MQFIIFYFSGTGNTELVTKEIQKRLISKGHSVETISIEDTQRLNSAILTDKIVGFGFPVYKFSYPDIFNKLFCIFNDIADKNNCFIFSTYTRFEDKVTSCFSNMLDKSKYKLIAEHSFKAPSCGISARKPTTDYEYESVMFFEDGIDKKLDLFVDEIIIDNKNSNPKTLKKPSILNSLKMKIVADIEKTKYPLMTIDKAKCNLCGLCTKKCPDKNLVLTKSHIEIKDVHDCLHCLRCINHCPKNAILFGNLTIGDNQYTLSIRDALFKKSTSGYHEFYWENFKSATNKWRRNTLKYWLKHKAK